MASEVNSSVTDYSDFSKLLSHVKSVHERDIGTLRNEVTVLRKQLSRVPGNMPSIASKNGPSDLAVDGLTETGSPHTELTPTRQNKVLDTWATNENAQFQPVNSSPYRHDAQIQLVNSSAYRHDAQFQPVNSSPRRLSKMKRGESTASMLSIPVAYTGSRVNEIIAKRRRTRSASISSATGERPEERLAPSQLTVGSALENPLSTAPSSTTTQSFPTRQISRSTKGTHRKGVFSATIDDFEVKEVKPLMVRIEHWLVKYFPTFRLPCFHSGIQWWINLSEPKRYGRLAAFVESFVFNAACMLAIMLNGLFIVISTDRDISRAIDSIGDESDDISRGFQDTSVWTVEICFTSFYVVELLLKIIVHKGYFFVMESWRWNMLDTCLVLLSVFDVGVYTLSHSGDGQRLNLSFIRALRVLKIVKILRMLRAVKFIQELRLMLECVVGSFMALFWCLALIVFVLYLFALVFVQGMANYISDDDSLQKGDKLIADIENRFGGTIISMVALFESTTGGTDWENMYDVISEAGWFYQVLYLFFIAFFVIAAWNIVTSTFVEKILKLAIPDIESLIKDKRNKDMESAGELLSLLAQRLDGDKDSVITIDQFRQMFQDPKFRAFFAVRGLDLKDAESFFDMLHTICDENDAVDIKTFVGACLRLQGLATSLDLQTLHFDMKNMLLNQLEMLYTIVEDIENGGKIVQTPTSRDENRKPPVRISLPASETDCKELACSDDPLLDKHDDNQIQLTKIGCDSSTTKSRFDL